MSATLAFNGLISFLQVPPFGENKYYPAMIPCVCLRDGPDNLYFLKKVNISLIIEISQLT